MAAAFGRNCGGGYRVASRENGVGAEQSTTPMVAWEERR